jgi:threonine/homoserine/homoserine lactone efflux protein
MVIPFFAGMALGFSVAAPIGPMGVLCIQRTLTLGPKAGIVTGFGAASVHFAYGTFVLAGFGMIAPTNATIAGTRVLSVVAALSLFWLAARSLRHTRPTGASGNAAAVSLVGAYTSAIALGAINPSTMILFGSAFPALGGVHGGGGVAFIILGIFSGSVAWWLMLTLTVSRLRSRFDARAQALTRTISALVLAGLGVMLLSKM